MQIPPRNSDVLTGKQAGGEGTGERGSWEVVNSYRRSDGGEAAEVEGSGAIESNERERGDSCSGARFSVCLCF